MSESLAPCLVLAEARSVENTALRLFVSNRWKQDSLEADHGYITAFIEHVLSLPRKEIEQFLINVEGISVGPLRPSESGICDELELTFLLKKIFGEMGYDVLDGTK